MGTMPVRAVVFDLFHTLVDTEHLRPPGYHYTWAIADLLEIEPEPFRRFWDRTYFERETTPIDLVELIDRYLEGSGQRLDDRQRDEIDAHLGIAKDDALRLPEPAMVELVADLAARSPVGVLSNCHERETRAWPSSPFASHVQVFVRSCDVGVMKPELGAYQAVLEPLGADPAESVFVGNGGSDELAGAAAAGFGHVVHCNVFDRSNGLVTASEQKRRAGQSHASVETIADLRDTLESVL